MKSRVEFSPAGLKRAGELIDKYEADLKRRVAELVNELAEVGRESADKAFATADYDGTNDVVVSVKKSGSDKREISAKVIASGASVLFIEFGTGVFYSDPSMTHPLADEFGYTRGGYGYHLGLHESWRYRGNPGTNGVLINSPGSRYDGYVLTHGNPANRCMYNAAALIRDNVRETAERIF